MYQRPPVVEFHRQSGILGSCCHLICLRRFKRKIRTRDDEPRPH